MTSNTVPAPATRNVFATHGEQDRAIVLIATLRATRAPGQKGVGANRDDWPIFKDVSDTWSAGQSPPKDLIFQARHRVQKYHKQITSAYGTDVTEGDIRPMLQRYAKASSIAYSTAQLHEELLTEQGYGNW